MPAQQILKIKRAKSRLRFWPSSWIKCAARQELPKKLFWMLLVLVVIRRAARADRIIKGMSYKTTDDKGATIKVALTNLVADLASLGRNVPMPLPGRAVLEDD